MDFWIFGSLSLFLSAATVVWVSFLYPRLEKSKLPFSRLKHLTAGIFLAAVLIFIPVYYHWDGWNDGHAYLRPVILSVLGAMRLFLLGIDFDIIEQTVVTDHECFKVLFSLYAAILYIVAPLLTFSNVLSLFQNMTGSLLLRVCRSRPIYIMSELNIQSVILSESIVKAYQGKYRGRPLIVFAGVFTQNAEENYGLLLQSKKLNAICLKKDAARLLLNRKGKPAEFFLICKDDSENVAQAIRLTGKYKDQSRKVSVYVFSPFPGTDGILDSLDKGMNSLNAAFLKKISDAPEQILYGDSWTNEIGDIYGTFSIRRIDEADLLVMDKLTSPAYRMLHKRADSTNTVSIAILGMGRYGVHLLKSAVWYYQMYGCRVEINVFDREETGSLYKRLGQECPELLSMNGSEAEDDARYDIRFFSGIDCFTTDFDELFLNTECQRLEKTQLVFVALGDDDSNLQAAIQVRKLFAQLHPRKHKNENPPADELPYICAVIVDEQKAINLNALSSVDQQEKYGGNSYHIQFARTFTAQSFYPFILRSRETEKKAFKYHVEWISKQYTLEDLQDKRQREKLIEQITNAAKDFVNFSYYRQSSVATALHREMLSQYADYFETVDTPNALAISEHMRWNAYMRSIGYRYGKVRDDRGLIHPNLVRYSELPLCVQKKDELSAQIMR